MTRTFNIPELIQTLTDTEKERDFLADQVDKLETVIDEKQATIDRMRYGNRKKLTKREVAQIRELWETTAVSQAALGRIYDVNPATISRTVRDIYHKRG